MAPDLSRPGDAPCHPVVVAADAFVDTAARYIAQSITAAARERELISLALSGGTSPRPVYQTLAHITGLPWGRVEVFFADERAVPPEHAESNYRLVKESLLDLLRVGPAAVYRMEGERSDLACAARDYERLVPDRLDVLVLGIGGDGHTASLFPGHPALGEERRRVLAVQGPTPPTGRITITPPVIRAARTVLMLVAGKSKAQSVERACQGPFDPVACPAQLARLATWIVDEPAASLLPTGAS